MPVLNKGCEGVGKRWFQCFYFFPSSTFQPSVAAFLPQQAVLLYYSSLIPVGSKLHSTKRIDPLHCLFFFLLYLLLQCLRKTVGVSNEYIGSSLKIVAGIERRKQLRARSSAIKWRSLSYGGNLSISIFVVHWTILQFWEIHTCNYLRTRRISTWVQSWEFKVDPNSQTFDDLFERALGAVSNYRKGKQIGAKLRL